MFLGTTPTSTNQNSGTIFRITAGGEFSSLLTLNQNSQGAFPVGQLYPASNGLVYGITQGAGPDQGGTVFVANGRGNLKVLASNVNTPSAVTEATDGNFYFMSYNSDGTLNILRMSLGGTLSTVYTFPYGVLQAGPLTQSADGDLFGETQGIAPGYGTIYRLTLAGQLTTLYSFTGGADGSQPLGGLIQGNNGLLYGVTNNGGSGFSGTIFSISVNGTLTTLHAFNTLDGANPLTGLTLGSDGNIYGTNAGLGQYGPGTIFKIAPDGSGFQTMFTFSDQTPQFAQVPGPGVVQGSDGKFYGTTLLGGADNQGQIYSVDLGLPGPAPLVGNLNPASGAVGSPVLIAGRNLIGVSSVTFNGVPATKVVSRGVNYVWAIVPDGATTGPVQVTTQNGVSRTNKTFTVN